MECGLSSPPEGGATIWLTWEVHHNMSDEILIGNENNDLDVLIYI
jgi:hypothetical protein